MKKMTDRQSADAAMDLTETLHKLGLSDWVFSKLWVGIGDGDPSPYLIDGPDLLAGTVVTPNWYATPLSTMKFTIDDKDISEDI